MKHAVVKKTLRLEKEDAELLCQKAALAGMSENGYLRMLIRDNFSEIPQIHGLIKTLINEVNHIGVNINQIVHHHNYELYSKADREQLIAYMRKLNATLKEAVVSLGNQ